MISVEDATRETHITQQQVSRWRKALDDEAAYRDKLLRSSYRAAMALAKRERRTEPIVPIDGDLTPEQADEVIRITAKRVARPRTGAA